eukprot:SAG31_NODE_50_length_30520_cov_89.906712_28_plen_147_part_00
MLVALCFSLICIHVHCVRCAGVEQLLLGMSDEAQLAAAGQRARHDSALSEDRPSQTAVGIGQELRVDVIKNPSNLVFGPDGALFVACFTLDHVVRFELQRGSNVLVSGPTEAPGTLSAAYRIFARELDGPSALAFVSRVALKIDTF